MTGERLAEILETPGAACSERFDGVHASGRVFTPAGGVFALCASDGRVIRVVFTDRQGFEHHIPGDQVERLWRVPPASGDGEGRVS